MPTFQSRPGCVTAWVNDSFTVLTPEFEYVLLDEVGSVIMAAITEPADVDTIARIVCAEFDGDPSQVAADLRHYLPTLVTAGLAVHS